MSISSIPPPYCDSYGPEMEATYNSYFRGSCENKLLTVEMEDKTREETVSAKLCKFTLLERTLRSWDSSPLKYLSRMPPSSSVRAEAMNTGSPYPLGLSYTVWQN